MQVSQRKAHIAGGMQDVGSDDEVERLRFKFLFDARFFEIEDLEFDFRKRRQLLGCAGEKRRRHIAEDIGVQTALEQR